ncbi:hypothetical protein LCGC14_2730830, partial [marine sediment metagenome]
MPYTTIIKDNLWVIPDALPEPVCEYLIKHNETTMVFKPCTMNKVIDTNYRDSCEVHIEDHTLARMIWKFVKPYVHVQYQGRKLIGPHYKTFYLLRYGPGQQFHQHRDGHSTNSNGQKSFLTALIYLNSDCKGGETRTLMSPRHKLGLEIKTGADYFDAVPNMGTLVLMRHYLLHASMPMTKGIKYVLRFNILYENYGPWYAGGPTNKKFEGVGVNITAPDVPYVNNPIDDAWIKCEDECFQGRRKAPDVYW